MTGALYPHLRNQLGVAIASRASALAMVFLYGYLMPVEDYGVLNVYTAYLWIFGILMTLNLYTAVGRYVYREDVDFPSFLGTTLLLVTALYVAASALVLFHLERVAAWLGLPAQALPIALVVVYATVLESVMTQVTIAEQKSGTLFAVMATKAVALVALSVVLLLLYTERKYLGVLHADLACNLLLIVFFLVWLGRRARFRPRMDHLRYMAAYAVPLIPYMLSLTLLSQFDRVQIDRHFGKVETGLYSLAYNFGILFVILATVILNASTAPFFANMNRGDHAKVVRDAQSIAAVMAVLSLGVVLFGEPVAAWIAPLRYREALELIPPIAAGGFFLATFQVWVRILAWAHQTWLISLIALVGVMAKLGLNEWLLPKFGYPVAAATSLAAYGAMCVACIVFANRVLVGARIPLGHMLLQAALIVGIAGFGWWVQLPAPLDAVSRLALFGLGIWLLRNELAAFRHINRVAAA